MSRLSQVFRLGNAYGRSPPPHPAYVVPTSPALQLAGDRFAVSDEPPPGYEHASENEQDYNMERMRNEVRKLIKNEQALQNRIKALYENPGSIWAWNLYLLLQPEEVRLRWIGHEMQSLMPAIHALASRQSEQAWKEITRARTDPFTRQVLKNLHFLLAEAPDEIKMEPQETSSKQLPP